MNMWLGDHVEASGSASEQVCLVAAKPPKVLLVATLSWMFQARFLLALRATGFDVEVACPSGHMFDRMSERPRQHRVSALRPARDIAGAINRSKPDLLIPCDDRAVWRLHQIHAETTDVDLKALIERSLGRPDSFGVVASKSQLLVIAAELGLPTPKSTTLSSEATPEQVLAAMTYPGVLKRDGTWSGKGVRIVRSADEVLSAWRKLVQRPDPFTALKLAVFEGVGVLLDRLSSPPETIDCQAFMPGPPANRAALFINGEEVGGVSVITRETSIGATGPSTVVEVTDHADMASASRELGRRLGLTGFYGFDFIVSEHDGRAYLLEVNARLTPIAGMPFAGHAWLPQALLERMFHHSAKASDTVVQGKVVALFPDEWSRDPNSPYLRSAHHDVPWQDPALVRIGLGHLEQLKLARKVRAVTDRLAATVKTRGRR